MNLSSHLYAWPAQLLVLGWELVGMYQRRYPYLDRIIEEFSFNNSLLTKTGIQYQDSLRASSPRRSGGEAGNGRRACNYGSGIWISICTENVGTKCWLAEMTLVMTSLPLVVFAQSTGSHRSIRGEIQIPETHLRALLPFPAPQQERPGELTRRVVLGPGSDGVESTIQETKTVLDSLTLRDKNRDLNLSILK